MFLFLVQLSERKTSAFLLHPEPGSWGLNLSFSARVHPAAPQLLRKRRQSVMEQNHSAGLHWPAGRVVTDDGASLHGPLNAHPQCKPDFSAFAPNQYTYLVPQSFSFPESMLSATAMCAACRRQPVNGSLSSLIYLSLPLPL